MNATKISHDREEMRENCMPNLTTLTYTCPVHVCHSPDPSRVHRYRVRQEDQLIREQWQSIIYLAGLLTRSENKTKLKKNKKLK